MRHGPLLVGMHLHEMDLGQYARARASFEQGIALCEEDKLYPSWLVRAESCVKHAQLQDALAAADAALTLRPGEADALLVRIRALRGLGRDREADSALDRLYEVDAARADAFLLSGE
jgi:predicted Zn-dependent protease